MTADQMKDALAWKVVADKLRTQLDEYVLLKRDAFVKEVVCLGDPIRFKQNDYHRVEVPMPDEARRFAFRLWQYETTLKYNDACRRMAQYGLVSDHALRPLVKAFPPKIGDGA